MAELRVLFDMDDGIWTIHYELGEEYVLRPMYPSIGWDSTYEGARAFTAAYLRACRRLGARVSVVVPPSPYGDAGVYHVTKGDRTIVVVLDAPEDEVRYHRRRQDEIAAEMRARGEIE